MKKIISGNDLKEKMIEAINLLCDTVKVTLGPKGNNVIIDHSSFQPFITNDGVTIAQNIESDDEIINTILELAKEASIKTNEIVGDGTTTTLVLLQSIFNNGLKLVEKGISPIILKDELDSALKNIINLIEKRGYKPSDRDLLNIATVSSNDKKIGKLVFEAFDKTKNKDAIKIIETEENKSYLSFIKGYTFETIIASPYFFNDKNNIYIKNAKILLLNKTLEDIEDIANIINEIYKSKNDLVIIATDYDNYFVNTIISLNMENDIKIYLLKTSNYGFKQISILKDISAITNTNVINHTPSLNDLGLLEQIIINEDTTNISFKVTDRIKSRINEIEKEIKNCKNNLDKDFYSKILSMFNSCLVNIYVSATTILERREKKMRFDDALCAISTATNGVLPGTGISLLEISDNINSKNSADIILKEALLSPIIQILKNAGLNHENIINEIRNNKYQKLYNVKNSVFENIENTLVIDSKDVVINSLKNAVSIASMLLTTSAIVINEYKNNLNKINNFNEI